MSNEDNNLKRNLYAYCSYNKIETFISDVQAMFVNIYKNKFRLLKMKCALEEHYTFSLLCSSCPNNFAWLETTDDEKLNINTLNVILSKFNEHGALKDDTLKSNLDGFITIYSLNNKIKEDEYINTFYRRVKEKCDELNNNS